MKRQFEQYSLNHVNEQIETLNQENKKLRKEFTSIKLEMEYIKESLNIPDELYIDLQKAQESANKTNNKYNKLKEQNDISSPAAIPDDLLDRLAAAEKNANESRHSADKANNNGNQLRGDVNELKHQLKCMKYEVKKLKERPIPEAATSTLIQTPADIPDDLLDRLAAAEKNANEAKRQMNALRQEGKKMNSDLECLKYAVKKLKETEVPVQELAAPAPAEIPDDLLDRLAAVEKNTEAAYNIANNMTYDLNLNRENNKMIEHDLNCMKYEVKKLKQSQIRTNSVSAKPLMGGERTAPASIPDELYQDLQKAQNSANNANNKYNKLKEKNDKLKEDIRYIKKEVKRLKEIEVPVQERAVSYVIPDDLLERLDNAEKNINQLRGDNTRINHDLNCMKYEVKRLKERPIGASHVSAKPFEESEQTMAPVEIPDELYQDLQNAQELANKANNKYDKLKTENDKLKEDLRCIKSEVKKLKEYILDE